MVVTGFFCAVDIADNKHLCSISACTWLNHVLFRRKGLGTAQNVTMPCHLLTSVPLSPCSPGAPGSP